jgi:hypothetical protein
VCNGASWLGQIGYGNQAGGKQWGNEKEKMGQGSKGREYSTYHHRSYYVIVPRLPVFPVLDHQVIVALVFSVCVIPKQNYLKRTFVVISLLRVLEVWFHLSLLQAGDNGTSLVKHHSVVCVLTFIPVQMSLKTHPVNFIQHEATLVVQGRLTGCRHGSLEHPSMHLLQK